MVSSRTEYYHGRIPGLTPCQPRPGGLSAPPAVPSRNSRGSDFEGSAGAEGERIFTAEIRTHFEQLPAKTSLIAALWRAVPRNRAADRLSAPVRGLSTVTADSGFRVSGLSCHVKSSVAMPWVPSPVLQRTFGVELLRIADGPGDGVVRARAGMGWWGRQEGLARTAP